MAARFVLPVLRLCAAWLVAANLAVPAVALACGGCFFPGANASAPVLQDAERILFVRDAKTKKSTVWVEIRYSGPPGQFGWVLPLPKVPKLGVGSSFLFDQLQDATAPRVALTPRSSEGCSFAGSDSMAFGCGDSSAATSGGAAFAPEAAKGTNGVTVLQSEQVGPYDTKVISGTTADGVLAWLTERGYGIPATAKGILADHVKQGHVFVAVKLSAGAGVREIKPIELTMDDAEPCVPLRLTSIAAVKDTAVQVWVAGPGRAIPKNHLHVQVNPMRLDLLGGLGNYQQVLSEAIDEASGRAFVTEFAGEIPKTVSFLGKPVEPLFDAEPLSLNGLLGAKTRCQLLAMLYGQGFPLHNDVLVILDKHLGMAGPLGLEPEFVYSPAVSCVDPVGAPFDASPVVAELMNSFVTPVLQMRDTVAAASSGGGAQGRLTRLAMRISPEEMTKDPVFSFAPALPDVSQVISGEVNVVCEGPRGSTRVSLPKLGTWVIPNDGTVNSIGQQTAKVALDKRFSGAPSALVIELLDETAAPLPIHPADIGIVDAAIAGAHWNEPALPAGLSLKTAPKRWIPPASDAIRKDPEADNGSCAGHQGLPRSFGLLVPLALAVGLVGARRRRA